MATFIPWLAGALGTSTTAAGVGVGLAAGAVAANNLKSKASSLPQAVAPPVPTADSASNITLAQQDSLRKRRGIYANILSSSNQGAPGIPSPPANKTVLG